MNLQKLKVDSWVSVTKNKLTWNFQKISAYEYAYDYNMYNRFFFTSTARDSNSDLFFDDFAYQWNNSGLAI